MTTVKEPTQHQVWRSEATTKFDWISGLSTTQKTYAGDQSESPVASIDDYHQLRSRKYR